MPSVLHHHHHAIMRLNPDPPIIGGRCPSKPNPKFLSLFLQAIIMTFAVSLFFLFVGVAAIVLIHLCIAGGALRRRRRRRRTQFSNSGDGAAEDTGYPPEDLRKLPRFNYVPKMGIDSDGECCVCLDSFREGESCRRLPGCNHMFHLNCVDEWLIKVPACPVCRARVNAVTAGSIGAEDCKQLWAIGG